MTKLEKAEKIIKEYILDARFGIYNTRNICGDPMVSIYNDGDLQIDICYPYEYFEVFGLENEEFAELSLYYNLLK